MLRVARSIRARDKSSTQQVVFYDWEVGSYCDSVRGCISGSGMERNIQDGYRFFVQNYGPGDEIFCLATATALIGFERLREC